MAILINEQLFMQRPHKSTLRIAYEPEVIGIASDAEHNQFVYRTNERGQIAWEKTFYSFDDALSYARKMYLGLQGISDDTMVSTNMAIKPTFRHDGYGKTEKSGLDVSSNMTGVVLDDSGDESAALNMAEEIVSRYRTNYSSHVNSLRKNEFEKRKRKKLALSKKKLG